MFYEAKEVALPRARCFVFARVSGSGESLPSSIAQIIPSRVSDGWKRWQFLREGWSVSRWA